MGWVLGEFGPFAARPFSFGSAGGSKQVDPRLVGESDRPHPGALLREEDRRSHRLDDDNCGQSQQTLFLTVVGVSRCSFPSPISPLRPKPLRFSLR